MTTTFSPSHRGGAGPPMLLLHGFTDTWRTWDLVLPALERQHEVLAPTLLGHAGAPPLVGDASVVALVDALERAMDEAGFETAHVVGNSLGGFLALQLAARGRARTVVGFAPAGGWAVGDDGYLAMLERFEDMHEALTAQLPYLDEMVATDEGRRKATEQFSEHSAHIPAELIVHILAGVAACQAVEPLVELARRGGWQLAAERIECPVRMVWGLRDRVLPWPSAAARYQHDWLPRADWVELDGVGRCPQLDVPVEAAQLVLDFAARSRSRSRQ